MIVRQRTPQQDALVQAVADGSEHVLAEALAGSGKTTTAIDCATACNGRKVGFVAFNKHIAQELQLRLNGNGRASTLHGLGMAAIMRHHPCAQVDEQKPLRLLRDFRPDWVTEGRNGGLHADETAQATIALSRLAKYTLTPGRDTAALASLAERHGVEMPEDEDGEGEDCNVFSAVGNLLDAEAANLASIDFDDMCWLPVHLGLPVQRFDVLLVDEAQDLSRMQQELARRAADGGRIVPIGDRHQSIYGFSGADSESIPRLGVELAATDRGCIARPLTTTFRCPLSHVQLAQQLVPAIQAAPGAIAGTVECIGEMEIATRIQPGDMVVSRHNAPLLSLAFKLILAGVPCFVRGRDLGQGLLTLAAQLKPDSIADLLKKLGEWRERELLHLERKNAPESQVQNIQDRHDSLKELTAQAANLGELQTTIRKLFPGDDASAEGKVVLSSAHRAKGLESDRVVILDPKSMPLIMSCRNCRGKGEIGERDGISRKCPKCNGRGTRTKPWEHAQELNLIYVAITRAKKDLLFAGPVPAVLGGDW